MSTDRHPCKSCGHPLQDQARFCQHCGAGQKAAVGEPSAAKIVISFLILILGVPGSLIAAAASGMVGGCTLDMLFGGRLSGGSPAALNRIAMAIGVGVFLLCMVAINAMLKSVKR